MIPCRKTLRLKISSRRYISACNATKFSSGSGWRENDLERFHSSGKHKKETKRFSTSIFLQKVCRNLYFKMNFQFTVDKHVEFHVYKCISLLFTTGVCYVYKIRAAKNFFFSSVNIFSFWNNRVSSQHSSVDRPSKGLKRTVAAEEAARAVKTACHCNKHWRFSRLDTDFANHFFWNWKLLTPRTTKLPKRRCFLY